MAIVTGFSTVATRKKPVLITSDVAQATDSVELLGLAPNYPHSYLSVHLLDGNGDPTTASAGVFTVEILAFTGQVYEVPCAVNTINATALTTVTWAANTMGVRVTVTTPLTGPTQWRILVSQNYQFEK